MKSGSGASSGSAAPSLAAVVVVVPTTRKCPGTDAGASLKKRSKRAAPEELVDASESTTEVHAGGGRESVEAEEVPERGYSIWDLCEVEDQAGVDRYFTSIMTRLKTNEGPSSRVHDVGRLVQHQHERILALRAANKELKVRASQELVAAAEHWAKELEETMEKLQAELGSLRGQRKDLEQEVSILRSSLDGAQDDRARLERDVLSLTEAMTLLEAELKAEGPKAVVAYKASRGFESSLKKMGRISYEFGHRGALEWLRGSHPEVEVEDDPFAECPKDGNIKDGPLPALR
ncbi:hypothetical protein B296_00027047 [Ensete ventricosum]|uniref:Uncharacterized protein n=1 Tax=Ensete ventricosum TaxID=4639 RepID=A0A426YUN9_ENSVE|nr:hypothetical protein B296_00027047 [Ensete ventricosum]